MWILLHMLWKSTWLRRSLESALLHATLKPTTHLIHWIVRDNLTTATRPHLKCFGAVLTDRVLLARLYGTAELALWRIPWPLWRNSR
jgi:hypothetical protein